MDSTGSILVILVPILEIFRLPHPVLFRIPMFVLSLTVHTLHCTVQCTANKIPSGLIFSLFFTYPYLFLTFFQKNATFLHSFAFFIEECFILCFLLRSL